MKTKNIKKTVIVGSLSVVFAGAILFAAEKLQLSTDLNYAVQHIEKVVFAVADSDGTWKSEGQVEVTADNTEKTISINGSLITNAEQQASTNGEGTNISVLGGKDNSVNGNPSESTIIGGEGNSTTSQQIFIGGGKGNSIGGNSSRSTILGGVENSINGETSTIIGGEGNEIAANNATIIGNENTIRGDDSLAVGDNVNITSQGSFGWNDGTSTFSVATNNIFAINGQYGAVVATNTPHSAAVLTLDGDLRVQVNDNKKPACNSTYAGVVKSINNVNNTATNPACPCLCDGSNWVSLLDTPGCLKTCDDVRNIQVNPSTMCGSDYNTCQSGYELLEYKSHQYEGDATTNNKRHWMCQEKNTGITATCSIDFKCKGSAPVNSVPCSDTGSGLVTNLVDSKLVPTCSGKNPSCEYVCDSGFTYENGTCKSDCNAGSQTINGYSYNVPALTHGQTSSLVSSTKSGTPTNGTTTCNSQFKCTNGTVSVVGSPSCTITCASTHRLSGNTCVPKDCTVNTNGYVGTVSAGASKSLSKVTSTSTSTTTCSRTFTCSAAGVLSQGAETCNTTCNGGKVLVNGNCVDGCAGKSTALSSDPWSWSYSTILPNMKNGTNSTYKFYPGGSAAEGIARGDRRTINVRCINGQFVAYAQDINRVDNTSCVGGTWNISSVFKIYNVPNLNNKGIATFTSNGTEYRTQCVGGAYLLRTTTPNRSTINFLDWNARFN